MHEEIQADASVIDAMMQHVAEAVFETGNLTTSMALLDLSRTARKEINMLTAPQELPVESYEGILLYRLLPEIARRLSASEGAILFLSPSERSGEDVASISGDTLRRFVSTCLDRADFRAMASQIRTRIDPHYKIEGKFFALEAIDRDVRAGNIIEIALAKIAPAPSSFEPGDTMSKAMSDYTSQGGNVCASWNPGIVFSQTPFFLREDAANIEEDDQNPGF